MLLLVSFRLGLIVALSGAPAALAHPPSRKPTDSCAMVLTDKMRLQSQIFEAYGQRLTNLQASLGSAKILASKSFVSGPSERLANLMKARGLTIYPIPVEWRGEIARDERDTHSFFDSIPYDTQRNPRGSWEIATYETDILSRHFRDRMRRGDLGAIGLMLFGYYESISVPWRGAPLSQPIMMPPQNWIEPLDHYMHWVLSEIVSSPEVGGDAIFPGILFVRDNANRENLRFEDFKFVRPFLDPWPQRHAYSVYTGVLSNAIFYKALANHIYPYGHGQFRFHEHGHLVEFMRDRRIMFALARVARRVAADPNLLGLLAKGPVFERAYLVQEVSSLPNLTRRDRWQSVIGWLRDRPELQRLDALIQWFKQQSDAGLMQHSQILIDHFHEDAGNLIGVGGIMNDPMNWLRRESYVTRNHLIRAYLQSMHLSTQEWNDVLKAYEGLINLNDLFGWDESLHGRMTQIRWLTDDLLDRERLKFLGLATPQGRYQITRDRDRDLKRGLLAERLAIFYLALVSALNTEMTPAQLIDESLHARVDRNSVTARYFSLFAATHSDLARLFLK